jgi:hypothetical protein
VIPLPATRVDQRVWPRLLRPATVRPPLLVTDLRFEVFAILFALGTIHHELQFVLEQQLSGPLTGYLERSALVRPTVPWPSSVGIGLHLGCMVLAVLMLVLPWRRLLACLLAVTFLFSYAASPERIPSHNTLMAAGLAVVLLFGLMEVLGRWRLTPLGFRTTDWYGWTLTGLAWCCALTYWFAAFHKLNPRFFEPSSSPIQVFIVPFARLLGLPGATLVDLVALPLIVATVLTEASLPFLLWYRPTRLYGCLLGIIFHLVMMSQAVQDFPILIVAFYPTFLSVAELQQVLQASLRRPSRLRLAATLIVGVIGIRLIRRSVQLGLLVAGRSGSDLLLTAIHHALLYASFLLFVHLALSLGTLLVRREPALPVRATGSRDANDVGRSQVRA